MVVSLDMRALDQVNPARIDDDETGAGAQTLLKARPKNRMRIGRIGADHDHNIRLVYRLEILRARRGAKVLEAEASRRVKKRAQVSMLLLPIRREPSLNREHFFVGAARS
jgi:hypothetical protein